MRTNEKKEEIKLMATEELVNNMDILYHVKRKSNEDRQQAISYMDELIYVIKDCGLEQAYSSPTELIINAILCYQNSEENIDSEVDRNICRLIHNLGYMKK